MAIVVAGKARPDRQLLALQPELDPDGSHGVRKIWAALKSLGLDVEDLDPAFVEQAPGVHPKVPKERAEVILEQRHDIRYGLRQSRVQQVREVLPRLKEDDVRRFERCGDGVRPIQPDDIPPVDNLQGMAEVKALQQKQMERVQKDQERKANAICTDFLLGKRRAEEADAQIEALEKRLLDYRNQQEKEWKVKRAEAAKAADKRAAGAQKAAEARLEYERELEERATEKLRGARARRAERYSMENLKARSEMSNAKREAAFNAAIELEARTLASLEDRQKAVEQRLEERRQQVADEIEERRREAQAKYLQKQVAVQAMIQEWAEQKLKDHKDFTKKFAESRARSEAELKARSKSCADITRKATDKWRSNYERLLQNRSNFNEELMERMAAANNRVEHELKPMKLKCGLDVFSHIEVKDKTFGDLQARRWKELQQAQDAQTQALCIKIAEDQAKQRAKAASLAEVKKKRTESAKEILRYANHAGEVFQKIQSEPNEMRIRAAMEGLGFKMPKLPDEDDEPVGAS